MKLKNVCGTGGLALTALLGTLLSPVLAPLIHAQELSMSSPLVRGGSPAHPAESASAMLRESYQALEKGKVDAALLKVNEAIKLDSHNSKAYLLRGSIYAKQNLWDKASYDYDLALVIDPDNVPAKFNQTELKFMQKKYDEARPGFAALVHDKDVGDFATYKVFLCDLLGAHEDVAAKELDAINQVGGNPSYYFANAAWDLVHNKTSDAADWLKSAARIYSNAPQKFTNYTRILKTLGYLPLHLSSTR